MHLRVLKNCTLLNLNLKPRLYFFASLLLVNFFINGCSAPQPKVQTDKKSEPIQSRLTQHQNTLKTGEIILQFTAQENAGVMQKDAIVSQGIPFPRGALYPSNLKTSLLLNSSHQPQMYGKEIRSLWPNGSIRWLGITFKDSFQPNALKEYLLVTNPKKRSVQQPKNQLSLNEQTNIITIDTGPMQVEIDKTTGKIFKSIQINGKELVDASLKSGAWLELSKRPNPYLKNPPPPSKPELYTSQAQTLDSNLSQKIDGLSEDYHRFPQGPLQVVVESSNPYQTHLRISGSHFKRNSNNNTNNNNNNNQADFDQKNNSFFITRLTFTAGKTSIDTQHTFIFGGAESDVINQYGFSFPIDSNHQTQTTQTLIQTDAEHFTSIIDNQQHQATGQSLGFLSDQHSSLHMKNMDYLYPLGLEYNQGIHALLHPPQAGPLDTQRYDHQVHKEHGEVGPPLNRSAQGISLTHQFKLVLSPQNSIDPETLQTAYQASPINIIYPQQWVSDSLVMGVGPFEFNPKQSQFHERADKSLRVIEEFMRVNQRQEFKWYGRWNYGDIRGLFSGGKDSQNTWYDKGRYGWAGNSGETSNQLWLQYLRAPNQSSWQDAEAMARHTADVQMVHFGNDPQDNGLWSGKNTQASIGSLHRHGQQAWSGYAGQEDYSHVAGLETYYYLTGDQRAKDSLYEAAEFIRRKNDSTSRQGLTPNANDVLTRAALIFHDQPQIQAKFEKASETIFNQIFDGNKSLYDGWVNGSVENFHLFMRFIPGLLYEHEYFDDTRRANLIKKFANHLTAHNQDTFDIATNGENASLYYYLNLMAYGLHLQQQTGQRDTQLNRLAEDTFETLALCNIVSDAAWQGLPQDWRDWQWSWDEQVHGHSPGILWLARQITFRNDYMQDYHSYRAFVHLPTLAYQVNGGHCR